MNLSKNLSIREAIKSITAKRLGIDNTPGMQQIENLKAIAKNVFQPTRDHFKKPIGISSGYRCQNLNQALGGSSNSQHIKGCALDIDAHIFGGVSNREVFEYIKENLPFDQLIWEFGTDEEPDWVHVSYEPEKKNRGQVLRAKKENGMTVYRVIT